MKVGFPGIIPFSSARTVLITPEIPAEHSEWPILLLIWAKPRGSLTKGLIAGNDFVLHTGGKARNSQDLPSQLSEVLRHSCYGERKRQLALLLGHQPI